MVLLIYWLKFSEEKWDLPISTTSILPLAIPICLLVIAVVAAATYFVVRHRRISNNFSQFVNSHYDTRRGQATFPGTADGLGEKLLY